jgi:hypothetical protein
MNNNSVWINLLSMKWFQHVESNYGFHKSFSVDSFGVYFARVSSLRKSNSFRPSVIALRFKDLGKLNKDMARANFHCCSSCLKKTALTSNFKRCRNQKYLRIKIFVCILGSFISNENNEYRFR